MNKAKTTRKCKRKTREEEEDKIREAAELFF